MQHYLEPRDDGLCMRDSGSWAAKKLDYLARYIDVFEKSMRSKWSTRNYIDLMAGPGKDRVRDSGLVLLGSPLLALTTRYAFTGYFFVDLREENTKALQQRCSASPYSRRVKVFPGNCNHVVDEIVRHIKQNDRNSLNLAFLDPEGFELEWVTVAKLASVRRMDLIINYPQGGLNRYMRQAHQTTEETSIDRFFGGTEWRELYERWQNRQLNVGLHRLLIDLYKEKLRNLGYTEVFRGDEEVGDEPLIRNVKRNAPLYRLLFASKHDLGYKFWRQVIRRDVTGQARLL